MTAQNRESEGRLPWCPVCRLKTATEGNYVPPNGFYETFKEHGDCDGAGRKVRDQDYGYVVNGIVVPEWEALP